MKRVWPGVAAGALLVVACGGPPAPPPPPTDRLPPPARASSCPPVAQFAHQPFFFADMLTRASCPVFLEQDECILAVFDDCTNVDRTTDDRSPRQWEGRIRVGGIIELEPRHPSPPKIPPPKRCVGQLQDAASSTARARLHCEGGGVAHPGLFIERQDPSAAPFGRVSGRLNVRPRSFPVDDSTTDLLLLAARRQLWALLAMPDLASDAGLIAYDLDTHQTYPKVPIPGARRAAASGQGDRIAASSRHGIHLVDTSSRAVVRSATVADEIGAIEMTADGAHIFVTTAARDSLRTRMERRRADAPAAVEHAYEVDGPILHLISMPPTASGVELVAIGHLGWNLDDGVVFALTSTLSLVWRLDYPFVGIDATRVPGGSRIALVSKEHNTAFELDADTGELAETIPNPFFDSMTALTYDARGDRFFVAGGDGHITEVHSQLRRTLQTTMTIEQTVTQLAHDPRTDVLYALVGELGYVEIISPQ